MIDRRTFLGANLGLACALASPIAAYAAKPRRKLRLLILGGTGFLGPHIVETATARGHTMTLFNRGKTNPHLFPELEKLQGDRKNDLSALAGRKWDAVIDTSGYFPADVERSVKALAANVGQYVFISTISVYAKLDQPGMDESAPLATIADPGTDKITGESYGPLKALCEQAAEAAMPGRVTTIRPGLIVGPGDPTDRFTYWPVRVARGGEVLAPGTPADPTQFIDVRDLAGFIATCIANETFGVFNVDAQAGAINMGTLLDTCGAVAANTATLTWVAAAFLARQNVAPWQDMPAWMPASGDEAGFGRISAVKAKAVGLVYRPLENTVRDTLVWSGTWPPARRARLRAGLSAEREAEVLNAWHAREQG